MEFDENKTGAGSNQKNEGPKIEINGEPLKKTVEQKIDNEIEQSFPASDPPSYSKPGNDDIEPEKEDIKEAE